MDSPEKLENQEQQKPIVPAQESFLEKLSSTLFDLLERFNMNLEGNTRLLVFGTFALFVTMWLLTVYWSFEPDLLDVSAEVEARATDKTQKIVPGYASTLTLIRISETLLDKPGGYISNDKLPPWVFMDNIPNWEFGVLKQVRDFAKAMREDIARVQTLDEEHPDLVKAEPRFNVDSNSWMMPSAEGEYRKGAEHLEDYLDKVANPKDSSAQFYARADNLRHWMTTATRRLGSLSKRLNASVGEVRFNTNLAGAEGAQQSTSESRQIETKTSWWEIDDIFYEARGTSWALINLLYAIEIDFKEVLEDKKAMASLKQIIRELEATQSTLWSPMVLNGSDFGLFANHSLIMSAYISRAATGLRDLRDLLARG